MGYKRFNTPSYEDRKIKLLPKVRAEYRHIAKDHFKLSKTVALDYSDNGRCWWVYQHVLNGLYDRY